MSNGVTTYRAFILVIVGRMSERAAQDKLDTYLATTGSASIKAALETDRTLGGACSSSNVTTATPRTVTVSGIDMIAYRYEMEVYG
jgi:pectate lyase